MEPPFTVRQFDHFVLHVRDLERSVAFYRMFGGTVGESGGRNTPVSLGPATRVLLHHDPDYEPQGQGNLEHFALVLDGSRDIEELLDYVRAHGAEPFDGPMENVKGFTQFRVRDPDGNEIELRVYQAVPA